MKGKITFVGSFWSYFGTAIGLTILSIVTLGLFMPYIFYWSLKYFFENLEVEMYADTVIQQVPQEQGRAVKETA